MITTTKPVLSHEEQLELVRRAKAGDIEARNALIETNLPLLHLMTKDYAIGWRLDHDDHIIEAVFGVIDAVRRFDESRGCRFSVAIRFAVRRRMQLFTTEFAHCIRPPVKTSTKADTAAKRDKLNAVRNPLPIGVPMAARRALDVPADTVDPMADDEREQLHRLIERLPARQRQAIELRYLQSHTLNQIAAKMDCSPEWARVLTVRAKEQLKQWIENDVDPDASPQADSTELLSNS